MSRKRLLLLILLFPAANPAPAQVTTQEMRSPARIPTCPGDALCPSGPSGPRGVTQQGTDPEGQACTPAGFNVGGTGYPSCGAGSVTAASSATPPRCSKTVTDHCVQAYERGVRR